MVKCRFSISFISFIFNSSMIAQSCPDWSPYFDQLDDSLMVQAVREQRNAGWSPTGVTYQQAVSQDEQLIVQFRQALEKDNQIAAQINAGSIPHVTGDQCRSMGSGKTELLALACNENTARNSLLMLQGINDLYRCRAGLPAASYTAQPTSPVMDESSGTLTSDQAAFNQGVDSMESSIDNERSNMANAAVQSWQPPATQQDPTESLSQNTTLSDPFASLSSQGNSDTTNEAQSDSSPASTAVPPASDSDETSSDQFPDPIPEDPQGLKSISDLTVSQSNEAPLSQSDISSALDAGTSNSDEVFATPVAQVSDSPSWDGFESSSGPSDEESTSDSSQSASSDSSSDGGNVDAADKQIDEYTNDLDLAHSTADKVLAIVPASDDMITMAISVTNAEAHAINHMTFDVFDGANQLVSGDDTSAAVEKVNHDLNQTGPTIGLGILNGLQYGSQIYQLSKSIDSTAQVIAAKVNSFECLFAFDPPCGGLFK